MSVTKTVSETTKQQALKALEGMREIVRHEMLIQGAYVDVGISNQRLANNGAICGGRKHCAIGSLWVGAGVKPTIKSGLAVRLPGTASWMRMEFLRPRHGLRLAYNALNEAAEEWANKRSIDITQDDAYDDGALETLFEGYYGEDLTKRDLLDIIAAAKRRIVKA